MSLVRWQLKDAEGLYTQALRALPPDEQKKALTKTTGRGRTASTTQQSPHEWAKEKVTKLLDEAKSATSQPAETATDLNRFEHYVAYGMTQSCSKCHDIKPTESAGELATVATGVGTSPRRWFKASVFDHDAHRDLGCKSCHFTAAGSETTSDLLMPDLNTAASGAQSCVQCHQPSHSWSLRNAPSDCVTCHVFHDRSFERPPMTQRLVQ
jgi:hypothetical protein